MTNGTGWRCGRASCRSPSPRSAWSPWSAALLLGSFSLRAESALIDPDWTTPSTASSGRGEPTPGRCPAPRPRPRSCPRSPDVRETARRVRAARTAEPSDLPCPRRACGGRAGIRAGAGTTGHRAAARPGLSAAARRGVDAAFVPVRPALGLIRGRPRALPQDFAIALASHCRRRRPGGQGAAGRRALAGGLGRGAVGRDGGARSGAAGPVRRRSRWRSGIPMWPNGCCKGTGACWSATAACPGWRDGGALRSAEISVAGALRAGVLDRIGGADPDRAAAGRHRRRWCASAFPVRPAPPAVRGRRRGSVGGGRTALAGGVVGRSVVGRPVWAHRPVLPRSRPAPNPASARWAAWPVSVASGTPTPYPLRGQHFSRWSPLSRCWAWWRPGLPRCAGALRRGRCWCWRGRRSWCPRRWPPGRGWRRWMRWSGAAGPRRAARRPEVGGAWRCLAMRWPLPARWSRCGAGCPPLLVALAVLRGC